jgi:hypothetical protein
LGEADPYRILERWKSITNPATTPIAPPTKSQMVLSLGEPVKRRDTSELNDWEAFIPKTMRMIPTASSAMEIAWFIVVSKLLEG